MRIHEYMNWKLPDVQSGFSRGRGTRDQIANIRWIIEKAKEFQKNIYFCFIYYVKAFDCVDGNKLLKILKEIGASDHLTFLLRNLMWVKKQQLKLDVEQWTGSIGKRVQVCLSSPCLFNLNSEQVNSLSRVWLFATPWTVAHQASPSMEFSRHKYWSGLPGYIMWNVRLDES